VYATQKPFKYEHDDLGRETRLYHLCKPTSLLSASNCQDTESLPPDEFDRGHPTNWRKKRPQSAGSNVAMAERLKLTLK
jgi:hypothetical protein